MHLAPKNDPNTLVTDQTRGVWTDANTQLLHPPVAHLLLHCVLEPLVEDGDRVPAPVVRLLQAPALVADAHVRDRPGCGQGCGGPGGGGAAGRRRRGCACTGDQGWAGCSKLPLRGLESCGASSGFDQVGVCCAQLGHVPKTLPVSAARPASLGGTLTAAAAAAWLGFSLSRYIEIIEALIGGLDQFPQSSRQPTSDVMFAQYCAARSPGVGPAVLA